MALTEVWRRDFNSDASVATFFTTPKPDGLSKAYSLRRVTQDGISCAEVWVGSEIPNVSFYHDAASSASAKMAAALGSWPDGTIAYCYDTDSTKHGRYVRTGGAWGTRTGSVTPPLADDENHRRTAQIRLIMQSWTAASDPAAPSDGAGAFPDKIGFPSITDWRNLTMRWRMRLIGGSMGIYTKIMQHAQTRVAGAPTIGSYPSRPFVNAMNRVCISDALGFGGNGLFGPNAVTYVADSGFVDIDIPFVPKWSQWLMMGGNDGAPGSDIEKMGRLPYSKSLHYVVVDPARWLADFTGNCYMLEAKMNSTPGTDAPVIPDSESLRGRLLFQSVALLEDV